MVALGGMPYPGAAAPVSDRDMAPLLQGCLGSSGPSVVTVGWDKAKDLLGAPWPSTKPHSQPGTPHSLGATPQQPLCSFGSCFSSFLFGEHWNLVLGASWNFGRSFVGPGSSSSSPHAPPLPPLSHLLNARAEWGKTSSSHPPSYGKWFKKPKNPHQNLGEREFHPPSK